MASATAVARHRASTGYGRAEIETVGTGLDVVPAQPFAVSEARNADRPRDATAQEVNRNDLALTDFLKLIGKRTPFPPY